MLIKTSKRAEARQEQKNKQFAEQMRAVIETKAQHARDFGARLSNNTMKETEYYKKHMSKSRDERSDTAQEIVSQRIHERNQMAGISDVYEVAERKAASIAELAEKKKDFKK